MEAIRHMLGFYRQIRASGCPVEEDGDMLLFQWGVYNWGHGETYSYDITRQFILSDGDGEISQLSLTVHFSVTDLLRSLKEGNRWCGSPDEADEFESFIRDHEATRVIETVQPLRTTLAWSRT